jgi:hypothetical protein
VRRYVLVPIAAFALLGATLPPQPLDPQFDDPCGDASTYIDHDGDRVTVEENQAHIDISSGLVQGVYEDDDDRTLLGVTASIAVCGEVSPTDGRYSIGWDVDDGCYLNATWTARVREGRYGVGPEGADVAYEPRFVLEERCYGSSGPLAIERDLVYRVELPADAVSFDGDTVTFTILLADLPPEARPRLEDGTSWTGLGALTWDQTIGEWAIHGNPQMGITRVNVRRDTTTGGDAYVVGEDRPEPDVS